MSGSNGSGVQFRLAPTAPRATDPPTLDPDQQRVVDHPAGPLLVLAGPGTGKTTTLVEAIVDRVERRGVDPASVLALTFSRKAAEQLRERVTARLGRTLTGTVSSTFHSFAYGLVRAYSPADLYAAPLRLLSAPEQDVVIQELLSGEGALTWPDGLRAAVATRGFAREVSAVLARARERGLDPVDLIELGERADDPAYAVAGRFLQRYLVVLDDTSAIDYPDLLRRAVGVAHTHREELRRRYSCVFVDEYQDTDPSQVALLRELAGDGRDLVVVGDPHQSIYGFRGADVRGILDFPAEFPARDGTRAPTIVLRTTRRFGSHLLLAGQRVAARLPLHGSIAEHGVAAFRDPISADERGAGRVEVRTFDSDRAEIEHLADLLRRAHLEDGVGWSDMAVLVRSGRGSIPGLRRGLTAAGVPVEVASDDTPLVDEPAVAPLLDALHVVRQLADQPDDRPVNRPDRGPDSEPDGEPELASAVVVDAGRAARLLTSPLAGLDATEVRALARALRQREVARADHPAGSEELVRSAVLDPTLLDGLPTRGPAGRVRALADLLQRARRVLAGDGTVEEVLWELWSGTTWPRRLREAATSGGPGARLAHRDLDAICALFETAARAEEHRGHTSVASFLAALAAQQLPADTLADRGVRGAAVRLMTAHRAKGLEWSLVVVAHVQEEGWPDLRRRSSLLQADRVERGELAPPLSTRRMLEEERRLFYVACTRARDRLVVSAVRSADEDGEQPSRFLDELAPGGVGHESGRPRRPLSMSGLVAALRRAVGDDALSEPLRNAAARRLARLATTEVAGRPVAPHADPGAWWGTRAPSLAATPLRPVDQPVAISASALTMLTECPARWFFEREAGGSQAASSAQGFGNLVHAVADEVTRADDEVTVDELMEQVDRVWDQLAFRTPWSSTREHEEARAALARFLAHHRRPDARPVLATEQPLRAEVTLPGGVVVQLHGYADRLELDAEGNVVVIDLKTGKRAPTDKSLAEHAQLGLYQLAVDHGAAEDLAPGARSGGAELWQLRQEVRGVVKVQRQEPQAAGQDGRRPVEVQLTDAVTAMREESFTARPGDHCRYCGFVRMCPAKTSGTVLH